MDEKINYKDVPKVYLYCQHKQYRRRNKCLRYQAMLSIPPTVEHYTSVNPLYIAGKESTCKYFQPFCTTRFALGMDGLLDNIPHSTAIAIRKDLYSLMGRSMFYRIRNKERLIHPTEQEQIFAIFLKHGIKTKPQFEQYIDKYDW